MKQTVRYLRTKDGLSLAWAKSGRGPPLVRASNWLTHLEYDWESPVWRHWTSFLAQNFQYVRYDERGCGMTDRRLGELSMASWTGDLEDVVDASEVTRPVILFSVSQGSAIAINYALQYPERVSRLVLYGGYAVGAKGCENKDYFESYQAIATLIRRGWNSENPVFRQLFTSRFIPDGTDEQLGWFNELCQRTTTPENAYRLMSARADIDIRERLSELRIPTLVLHADRDEVVPASEGRRLAAEIKGAEFVSLKTRNHILLEREPAWKDFCSAVLAFTSGLDAADDARRIFATLTNREQQVYTALCGGASNVKIAERLAISEKTVRNHLSSLFQKLGVHSRTEAIVLAREQDFRLS
ncbi:MAG TPA: alpha/beta fold hydrolase [Woeseiaceae bacterium]|nr:alpha/beta fold hydrolase [Woeseiaceae bacterium]